MRWNSLRKLPSSGQNSTFSLALLTSDNEDSFFEFHSHSANNLCSLHFKESSEPPRHLTLQIDLIESLDLLVGSGGKDLNQDAVFCPGSLAGHKKRAAFFKKHR